MEYGQTQPQTGTSTGTTGSMTDNLRNKMRDLPQQAEDSFESSRDRLNETLQDLTARLDEARSYAEEQVHARPWTAVGLGFGVGMVMGALITLAARR